MATNNGTPDVTPPDKRPRGGYSAPPPDESPRQDATADPKKEYVASSGYGAGLRDYLRALPVYVDDLTREVDLHVYERMRWDECVAGSLDALVYQALADDIDFRPAVDDEDSQYYDDSKAQADTINRVMADLDRPLIEWAYEMVSDAIGGGNRVSEKVVRQEEGGPYSGLWVWDRLKVKPRRHLSFAMDTFNNLRGILTAIPGTYMGLDGSIPVDPKETPNLLPREKFAVLSWNSHNDDPRGRPLLRRVYVPWWEKIQTAGEWLKHLSRFGSPSLVGTTAPNSDFVPPQDEFGNPLAGTAPGPEQALLNGLERLQNGGCLVLPYGATVTALQVAQSGSAFLTKVDQCDRAISRGVLLAIRAVMEAQHGSKADSQTAQDVTGLVVRYVKNWAARMITRDLVKPLIVWNKGADAARVICPYASLTPVEHQDWSQKATAVAALKTSGFLKPSQEPALAEEMGLPPATEPVEPPQPQPQPGQQPGQNGAQEQTAGTAQIANGAEAPFAASPEESGKDDPGPGEWNPWQRVNLEGWLEVYDPDTGEWLVGDQLDLPGDAEFAEWEESKHPRGQPENKGQFGPGGYAGTATATVPREQFTQDRPAQQDPRERRRERDRQRRTEEKARQEAEVKERLQKTATLAAQFREGLAPTLARLFPDGSVQPEDLPSLVGAPKGAVVHAFASLYSSDSLSFKVSHPYINDCQRLLSRRADGSLVMSNQMFFLDKGHRGSGLGLEVFSEEVRTLAGLGVDRIETCAGKSKGMNGYYTWARLGYDADLDDRFVSRLPNRMAEQLQEPFTNKVTGKTRPALSAEEAQAAVAKVQDSGTVQDLMATPEGREYWLRNGYQGGMRFDLKPGSRSLQVLNDYLQSKGKQPIEVSAESITQLRKERAEAHAERASVAKAEQQRQEQERSDRGNREVTKNILLLAQEFGIPAQQVQTQAVRLESLAFQERREHPERIYGSNDSLDIRRDSYQQALYDLVSTRHHQRMTSDEATYVRARQQLETEAARRGFDVDKVRQIALNSPHGEQDGVVAISEAYRGAMRYLETTSAPSAATFAEWEEAKHPRGQPENKGEFGPGGGGGVVKNDTVAKPEAHRASSGSERVPDGTYGSSRAKIDYGYDAETQQLKLTSAARVFFGEGGTPQDFSSAAGVPDGATVKFPVCSDSLVLLTFEGHTAQGDYFGTRSLERQRDGTLKLHNDGFSGKGVGLEMFGRQVENAHRLGFKSVETDAAGHFEPGPDPTRTYADENGYITWPKMGYDGPLARSVIASLPSSLKADVVAAGGHIRGLMGSREGQDWWLRNGETIELSFDLTPGSYSQRILSAYLKKRGVLK